MATPRLRAWLTAITGSAFQRGIRFRNGDRPNQATFEDLFASLLFKTEASDRAKEDVAGASLASLNGHVVASTDAQAKAKQTKVSDRTRSVQPSQLPEVIQKTTVVLQEDDNFTRM